MGNSSSSYSAWDREVFDLYYEGLGDKEKIISEADEENEEADGEGDAFDSLRDSIGESQKKGSECFRYICENKKYILQEPVMKKIVRDYVDNSLETSKFYRELNESLRMEKLRQKILQKALQSRSSDTPQIVQNYMKVNYFADVESKIETLKQRHEQTRTDIEDKKEKLKSNKSNTVWETIWSFVSRAMSAAAGVLKGLAIFLGSPPATSAVNYCSATIAFYNEKIVKYLKQCEANREYLKTVQQMDEHTSLSVSNLKETKDKVEELNSVKHILSKSLQAHCDYGGLYSDIEKIQEELIEKLDGLSQKLKEYAGTLSMQREQLAWA